MKRDNSSEKKYIMVNVIIANVIMGNVIMRNVIMGTVMPRSGSVTQSQTGPTSLVLLLKSAATKQQTTGV